MKFNKLKKLLAMLFAVVMIFSFSACNGNNKTRLNMGCFPNITHSQALYSMEAGSLDAAVGDDVKVEWFTFNAGPSLMEAMRAGNIDIGYIGPIPAITGYASSKGNITVIAGVTDAGSLLVTRKDLNISDVSELSGLTVAVPQFGNTQDILLRMLLKNAGLSSTAENGTVETVQQANANIKTLLMNKQIDAALVPEPWGTRLVEEAEANVILDYDDILDGEYPVAVIVVRNDYLKENRDIVKAFLKEHIRLTEIMQTEPLQSSVKCNEQIMRLTGVSLSESVLEASYDRINFTYNINTEAFEQFIKMCLEQGIISADIELDVIVDMSLLNEVIAELNNE